MDTIMLAFTIIMLAAIAGVLVLGLREMGAFLRKEHAYTLRRLTLRVLNTGMMLTLLLGILLGVRFFHLDTPEGSGNPMLWLMFWASVLLMTGGIVCLVIADFRTLELDSQKEANRLWKEIAQTIAEHEVRRDKDS